MSEYAKPGEPTCEVVSDCGKRCQFLPHDGFTHNAKYVDKNGVSWVLSWRTDLGPSKRQKKQMDLLGGTA